MYNNLPSAHQDEQKSIEKYFLLPEWAWTTKQRQVIEAKAARSETLSTLKLGAMVLVMLALFIGCMYFDHQALMLGIY